MGVVELLLVAMMPVIKTLLITVVGLYLALDHVNILSPPARNHLNNIVFYVSIPALVGGSLADTVTVSSIVSMWFMPVNIILTYIIGSALGWILVKITRPPDHLYGLIISCCAAGSLGNLPLIIVPAVCQEKNSPFGDSSICASKGDAYVSLSLSIGAIGIWTYAYNINRVYGNGIITTSDDQGVNGHDYDAISNSCMEEALLSKENGEISKADDFVADLSDNTICVPENNKMEVSVLKKIRVHMKILADKLNLKTTFNQITIATIVGLLIGLISPIRRLIVGDNAPLRAIDTSASMLADVAVPGMTLIMGANLLSGLRKSGVGLWVVVGIIVVRNIALPLMGVFAVKCASRFGLIGSDSLYRFVLLLHYAVPPTTAIGTITQLFGVNESECSVIMLWTYVVALFSLTLWSTYFMWLVS